MEFSTLIACTVTTLITIHVLDVSLRYWRRLPPGPAGFRLIKYALDLSGPGNRHRLLADLARYYGPVASFGTSMSRIIVVVSSPSAACEALSENNAGLADRFMPDTARALAHYSGSPLFLPISHPLWDRYRQIIKEHITSGRSLRHVRERHARRLAEHFRACSGRPVTVGVPLLGTVLNAVSSILFSKDDVVDLHEQGAQVLKDLLVELTAVSTKSNISDALPFLAPLDLFGLRRSFKICLSKLYKFLEEEFIEPRLALPSTSRDNYRDVLAVIIQQYENAHLTREDITKFFTDIFIAASESSSLTVQWAMAQLLRNPEKMTRVQAELAEILGTKDSVEESDLDKLPYLMAVVKETMRLHPVAPLIPRVAVADGVSLGGFSIPKGTAIVVNLWAIGRDEVSWPQPEEFRPERFLGDRAPNFRGNDFAFRPFGAGRRVCPGMNFAERVVPLLLASTLHKIKWSLPDGMGPEDVDLRDNYRTVLDLAKPLRAVPLSLD